MILIGSHALNFYIPLTRKRHDYDFMMGEDEFNLFHCGYKSYLVKETAYSNIYDIDGRIVEVRNLKTLDPTDKIIFADCQEAAFLVATPFGPARIPRLSIIYDMKKATALCIDEPKHKFDLDLMNRCYPEFEQTNSEFFQLRLKETQARVAKSDKIKHDFFHKYHIPEYIKHDLLHLELAELLNLNIPTYQRITTAETDISEELFNKLTHQQKISLMVEEVLVLNLERWYVPQNVENGINYKLIDKFWNNNEAMPTYLILKHVCLTGLKGETKYITDFGKANFFEIENEWIKAKEKIKSKGGFSSQFYNELFKARDKYKQGWRGIV